MKFNYREWGTYVADVTYEIKIEDINKILVENYPFTAPISEQTVMDIMLGGSDFDNTMITREDGVEEFFNDVIYDIVSDLRYDNGYTWDIVEADVNGDELTDIEGE